MRADTNIFETVPALRRVVLHESAHAIAAEFHGGKVSRIEILPEGRNPYMEWLPPRGMSYHDCAVVCCAGAAAEAYETGCKIWECMSPKDIADLDECRQKAGISESYADVFRKAIYKRAQALVANKKVWADIQTLSSRVAAHGGRVIFETEAKSNAKRADMIPRPAPENPKPRRTPANETLMRRAMEILWASVDSDYP